MLFPSGKSHHVPIPRLVLPSQGWQGGSGEVPSHLTGTSPYQVPHFPRRWPPSHHPPHHMKHSHSTTDRNSATSAAWTLERRYFRQLPLLQALQEHCTAFTCCPPKECCEDASATSLHALRRPALHHPAVSLAGVQRFLKNDPTLVPNRH